MVPWYHGTMVPWYHGTMVPRYDGITVPWYHANKVPLLGGGFGILFCADADTSVTVKRSVLNMDALRTSSATTPNNGLQEVTSWSTAAPVSAYPGNELEVVTDD